MKKQLDELLKGRAMGPVIDKSITQREEVNFQPGSLTESEPGQLDPRGLYSLAHHVHVFVHGDDILTGHIDESRKQAGVWTNANSNENYISTAPPHYALNIRSDRHIY